MLMTRLQKTFYALLFLYVIAFCPLYAQNFRLQSAKDTTAINRILALAMEACNNGQLDQTIIYTKNAREIAHLKKYESGIAKSYLIEARALFRKSKYPETIEYLRDGLKSAQKVNNSVIQSGCLNGLGLTYASLGNHAQALTF
jgi:tetratricopeptide (TPR) repeat protein